MLNIQSGATISTNISNPRENLPVVSGFVECNTSFSAKFTGSSNNYLRFGYFNTKTAFKSPAG
jgi:hypothetical protein